MRRPSRTARDSHLATLCTFHLQGGEGERRQGERVEGDEWMYRGPAESIGMRCGEGQRGEGTN